METLAKKIVGYWKTFQKPSLDVPATERAGNAISKEIKKVYDVFNELDWIKIIKDYQIYFRFAIVQLHILNDPVAYDLYISKMKSILEINKVFLKNFSQQVGENSSNFLVVNANGTRFGEIIQCSDSLRMLLGYSEEGMMR